MHPQNLDPFETVKLQRYPDGNPAVRATYEKRNEVCTLLLKKDQHGFQLMKNAKALIGLTNELKNCSFESLKTLTNTLLDCQVEIERMWHTSCSNGIPEGFYNKMEVISRRDFGCRNFKNIVEECLP